MKFDTNSADDVIEVREAVMDGGERTECVISIDTGDQRAETRLTQEQTRTLGMALVAMADSQGPTPGGWPTLTARCQHTIAGATEGKRFQCERTAGHAERCKAGHVYWQE